MMYGLACQLNNLTVTMVIAIVTAWVAMPMGTAILYHLVDAFLIPRFSQVAPRRKIAIAHIEIIMKMHCASTSSVTVYHDSDSNTAGPNVSTAKKAKTTINKKASTNIKTISTNRMGIPSHGFDC